MRPSPKANPAGLKACRVSLFPDCIFNEAGPGLILAMIAPHGPGCCFRQGLAGILAERFRISSMKTAAALASSSVRHARRHKGAHRRTGSVQRSISTNMVAELGPRPSFDVPLGAGQQDGVPWVQRARCLGGQVLARGTLCWRTRVLRSDVGRIADQS
jgi:hypothetical protein